jgi:hypothetical protein
MNVSFLIFVGVVLAYGVAFLVELWHLPPAENVVSKEWLRQHVWRQGRE